MQMNDKISEAAIGDEWHQTPLRKNTKAQGSHTTNDAERQGPLSNKPTEAQSQKSSGQGHGVEPLSSKPAECKVTKQPAHTCSLKTQQDRVGSRAPGDCCIHI